MEAVSYSIHTFYTCPFFFSFLVFTQDKYGQLGRSVIEGHDAYFRQCTSVNQKATDCSAGRWNSFVLTI